jgi:hypothetical protein
VFRPGEARLFSPNLAAWLLLELCPGCTDLELESRYIAAVGPALGEDEARRQAGLGIELLLREGFIERVGPQTVA